MRFAMLIGFYASVVLASACGGQVLVDQDGAAGDDGGGQGQGGAGSCAEVECANQGSECSCKTTCLGPDLRADCKPEQDGLVACECHYDDAYLGTCFSSGPVCGLPGGCCYGYLP
jgi:hypothetical protein